MKIALKIALSLIVLGVSLTAHAQELCGRIFSTEPSALFLGISHEDAGFARLHFLRQETKEIRAAYYQFDGNKLGKVAAAELIEAVKRGVRVRLLLDAWNPESWVDERISPELYLTLMKNGVQVRIFNEIDPDGYSKYLLPSNYTRMHDKLLILSSQEVVTTGDRNVQNSYFGPYQHKKGMKGRSTTSMEILVRGQELTRASEAYFDEMWEMSEPPTLEINKIDVAQILKLEKVLPKFSEVVEAANATTGKLEVNWLQRLADNPVSNIEFLHDKPGNKGKSPGIAEGILGEIDSAKKSVVIYAPYTFFSKRFLTALDKAIDRKVQVTLVLPSWQSVDTPITLQHFEKQAAQLRAKGVVLAQHVGDNFMHGKMMIVDESSVFVGSYNFNKRSELNDYESGFIVRDKEFAKEVSKFDQEFRSQESKEFKQSNKTFFEGVRVALLRFIARIVPFIGRQL